MTTEKQTVAVAGEAGTGEQTGHCGTLAHESVGGEKTWHCGTLTYTRTKLVSLFFFLLLGNFSFTMMMMVVPRIMPLKLKALNAPDWVIGALLSSVFPFFGMIMSPYISFKSDYMRTRWGRRKPFFVLTLPFITLSILLLAFSEDLSDFLHHFAFLSKMTPATLTITVMAVFFVSYQFFDVVVCSVYNYIFNDTVPTVLVGRFYGYMQMVSLAASFLFNACIFQYAQDHMKEIFIGTGIVYFVGIGLLCVFVKEGDYPAVTKKELDKTRGLAGISTYFRECFTHKFYWTKFLYSTGPGLAAALWPFGVFYSRNLGLSDKLIGWEAAIGAAAGFAAAYFASIFIDRWHPLRILAYSGVFAAALAMGSWVWLFTTLPPIALFWSHVLVMLIGTFHGALVSIAAVPLDIRLQPKSRYGQFCSAQGLIAAISRMGAGALAGVYFWFLKITFFHGSDYAYRCTFFWSAASNLFLAVVVYSLYRQWQALGGDKHFHPPASWSSTGVEEMEITPFVGTQTRWLNRAMWMVHAMFVLTILYLIPVTWWLGRLGWSDEFKLYWAIILPGSVASYGAWVVVERWIRADLARCIAGERMTSGIPHHGVFMVKSAIMLLSLSTSIMMLVVAIRTENLVGVRVFGLGTMVTNAMMIVAVLVLRRMERGYDPMLDYDGRKAVEAPAEGSAAV